MLNYVFSKYTLNYVLNYVFNKYLPNYVLNPSLASEQLHYRNSPKTQTYPYEALFTNMTNQSPAEPGRHASYSLRIPWHQQSHTTSTSWSDSGDALFAV